MPLCLGIHEYYSLYSIYVSDRLHKTFLSLQALGKKNGLNPFRPYQRFAYQENKNRYSSFTYRVTFEHTKQEVADSRHVVVLYNLNTQEKIVPYLKTVPCCRL